MSGRVLLRRAFLTGALAAVGAAAGAGCDGGANARTDGETPVTVPLPVGFEALPVPAHAPLLPARVALGARLFRDPSLSRDGTVSCASCHRADLAFADGRAVSVGIGGQTTLRSAPSLLNVAYRRHLHWDGGAGTLEAQALAPLEAENEMDADLGAVLARLNADPSYAAAFRDAFGGEGATVRTLTLALATFERTLVSTETAYDRARQGDSSGLSGAARRGLRLFAGRAGCAACHGGPLLDGGGDAFLDNGLARVSAGAAADSGRGRITQRPADAYRFRVPSLRAVARTAPYMHDGRLATLVDVVDHYARGGTSSSGTDPRIRPLRLTPQERADLVAFLQTLAP